MLCEFHFNKIRNEEKGRQRSHSKVFQWVTLGDGDWVITRAWTLGVWSRDAGWTCRVHSLPGLAEPASAFNKTPRWPASTSQFEKCCTLLFVSLLFENIHHHKNGKIKELAYEKSFWAKIGTAFLLVQKFAAKFIVFEASRYVLTSLHELSHSILLPTWGWCLINTPILLARKPRP